ncbi:MAG: C2 family cysteine protease, partial [Tepidisphaeraceae bacterium]
MSRQSNQSVMSFEPLESRTFLTISALSIQGQETSYGTEVTIVGTSDADQISISRTDRLVITNNGTTRTYRGSIARIRVYGSGGDDAIIIDPGLKLDAVVYGGEGNDTIRAGAGNDQIFGGSGRDVCYGYGGNDTFVSIGTSKSDYNWGGTGVDNFWIDNFSTEVVSDLSAEESAKGTLHRVGGFATFGGNSISRELNGQDLADPTLAAGASGYTDFSDQPLFPQSGPGADDICQGQLGDCYFLSTLSAIAKVNPQVIRNSVVDLGDGTYAVQFYNGTTPTFVRVDGELPTYSWGGLAYSRAGRQGAIWAAVMEKAFAFQRYGTGSYSSIESGWMGEAFSALGITSSSIWSATDATTLLKRIQSELSAGKAVTFATAGEVSPLVASHAYMVD